MSSKVTLLPILGAAFAFALTASCGDDFSVKSPPGLGGAAGETGTGGDSNTGGTSNTCTPECTDYKPFCLSGDCVECRDDDECSEGVCDEETHACVECSEASDCESQGKPFCESNECKGCEAAADCDVLGLAQCGPDGTCVACLTESDCAGKVCDLDTLTCTELPAHALNACQECEHDAECQVGQLCVEMSYSDPTVGAVGSFCLWTKDATALGAPNGACGLSSRPFASQAEVTSVDGVSATVCTLRTTTCPAFLQHATVVSECNVPGTDDAACGAAGFNDGRCRSTGSETMCTYPCGGNDARDCPSGFTCVAGSDRYCSL